jgi:F1F0 ATPase subunit 2
MNELSYILSFGGGVGLGTIFFGGLWLTVKKAVSSKMPALWILSSFISRVSITLFGFYFIGSSSWQRVLACMLGFIAARFILIYYTKSIDGKMAIMKEVNHET